MRPEDNNTPSACEISGTNTRRVSEVLGAAFVEKGAEKTGARLFISDK
jgi:hypothetical protein